jgi:patatin-like phospholipase/acyl hydrolase
MNKRFVLSIDGGGIRGVIPTTVLKQLQKDIKTPLIKKFDLIAGTSTGGIIALCLGAGLSIEKIHELYQSRGGEIFQRSFWRGMSSLAGITEEKYSHDNLVKILHEYLGSTILKELKSNIMVTAFNATTRQPYLFKSWRKKNQGQLASLAARATSAAPTYFEPVAIVDNKKPHTIIDGGVIVNDPSLCAYLEATKLWPGDEIHVVSLGTGKLTRPIKYEEAIDWGAVSWISPLISIFMDVSLVAYQMNMFLGNKYHRLQRELTHASDDMDNASKGNVQMLEKCGKKIIKSKEYKAVKNILII